MAGKARRKIVVVGAGAFGGWTALHLLRMGARVTLLDAWGPGNPRASSGGEGRAIRAIYGPDRIYSEMVLRAYHQWLALEKESGQTLYTETGTLWLTGRDDSYVRASLSILDDLGFPVEHLDLSVAARRYPQVHFGGVEQVFVEQRAGVLWARKACEVVRDQFIAEGGTWRLASVGPGPIRVEGMDGLELSDGQLLKADDYVFACGPWLVSLFPKEFGASLHISRQEVYYFGTPAGSKEWGADALPIWIDFADKVHYGFPDVHGRGFKFADDTRGVSHDPTSTDRNATPALLEAARAYIGRRFPGLKDAPLLEARVCQYSNSPDGNLIVDRHPEAANIWLAGGGCGHGFKLSPVIGEHLARRILRNGVLEPTFAMARLGRIAKAKTQFKQG